MFYSDLEWFPTAPTLTRTSSLEPVEVDLGSGVKIGVYPNSAKVLLSKTPAKDLPQALPAEFTCTQDGVSIKVQRTPMQYELLEGLMDEFPDSIKETISRVIEKE